MQVVTHVVKPDVSALNLGRDAPFHFGGRKAISCTTSRLGSANKNNFLQKLDEHCIRMSIDARAQIQAFYLGQGLY